VSNDNEYMRRYMAARYKRRKAYAIKKLGGRCVKCGSRRGLQFDHKNRRKNGDFIIAKRLAGVAEDKLDHELQKCQLLCCKCHNSKTLVELGQKEAKGTHGSLSAYRYCGPPKCESCRAAKRIYINEYRKTHSRKDGAYAKRVLAPVS
jgi:hypothetical protein